MTQTKKHSTIHYPADYHKGGGFTSWITGLYTPTKKKTIVRRRHKYKPLGKHSKRKTYRKK